MASVANPVDMIASATPEHYTRAMRAVLADERVDSLITIFIPPLATAPEAVAAAIVEGARNANGKPVLANFMSAKGAPSILSNIPSYSFPEAAASALARVTYYGEWRSRAVEAPPVFDDVRASDARACVDRAMERGGGWLDPLEIASLFDAAGIRVAKAVYASDVEEAVAAASRVGYPVALKAVGPTILHKTEAGAVALNLSNEAMVRETHANMSARLGASLAGVLIQEMVAGGVEVMVGATLDPTFGPLVLYGSGGILVELLDDVAFRITPLTDSDVTEMMREVKGTALLRGYRGAPAADEAALRDLLLRVSHLLEICPQILEMDANPIRVLEKGAVVVDARVRVGPLPDRPPTRRIAY